MIQILTYKEVKNKFMFSMKIELVNKGYQLGKLHQDTSTYCELHSIPFNRINLKRIINDLVIEYAVTYGIKIINPDIKKGKHLTGVLWMELRTRLFAEHKNECRCCGATKFLQADHIYPVSIYPELQLEYSNLQILCRGCNIRKGNRYVKKY